MLDETTHRQSAAGGAGLGRLRRAAVRLVDLALPQRCAACGRQMTARGLCGPCWARVDFISGPVCDRLGTPFPYDQGPTETGESVVSPAALANPPDFARARAVARHDGPARDLAHALKFNDRMETANLMAAMMIRAGIDLVPACQVVVPVPLHRRRLFKRRYNQAALLAERIALAACLEYEPFAIERVKSTRHQVGLNARERRRNVSGAFKVPAAMRPLVEGRRVLLVDDVLTTGATVNACARALRRAGAEATDVLTFSRVAAPV